MSRKSGAGPLRENIHRTDHYSTARCGKLKLLFLHFYVEYLCCDHLPHCSHWHLCLRCWLCFLQREIIVRLGLRHVRKADAQETMLKVSIGRFVITIVKGLGLQKLQIPVFYIICEHGGSGGSPFEHFKCFNCIFSNFNVL